MRISRLFIGVAALVGELLSADKVPTWPLVGDGLKPDPAIHWGQLENGLRYAIKHQPHPAGSSSFRMIILAGSLHEESDEVGIAHFTEHMAFNGTRKFRGESIGPKLAAAGIRFGPEVNAFTWPSHTIYQLDVAETTPEKLDLCTTVFREWASEIRFDRKQVEREKGVIEAEMISRSLNRAQLHQNRLRYLYPESILSQRPPTTTKLEIESVTPERLRSFYQKWYRPDNAIIIAAGDFDVREMEEQITSKFANWKSPSQPIRELEVGTITNSERVRTAIVHNAEVKTFVCELVSVKKRAGSASSESHQTDLALALGVRVLQKRLQRILVDSSGAMGTLRVTLQEPTPFARELSIVAEGRPQDWEMITQTVVEEFRRLQAHGILPSELDAPLADTLRLTEFATRHGTTETARGFAERLARAVVWGDVLTAVERNNELTQSFLTSVTHEEVETALSPYLEAGKPVLMMTSQAIGTIDESKLSKHLQTVLTQPVGPAEAIEHIEFPYTDFGPPGDIIKHRYDASLDVHMVQFANGVMLNLKPTQFNADSVMLTARLDNGGKLEEPDNRQGLANIAQGALIVGGLEGIEITDMSNALAGRFARLGFSVTENAFKFSGRADAHETELLFQLLTAYILEPAVRPEAVQRSLDALRSWYGNSQFSAESAMSVHSSSVFYAGDPRFSPGFAGQELLIGENQVEAWLKWLLPRGAMEVGIVGDFEVDAAIAFAAATLGTLPQREAADAQDLPTLQRTPVTKFFPVRSTDQRAILKLAWPAEGFESARGRRTMEILDWILQAQLNKRIREKLGATYSPSATRWWSQSIPNQGYLQVSITLEPQYIKLVYEETKKLAQRLGRGAISQRELLQAKAPLIEGVNRQLNSNSYWYRYVVSNAQTNPEALIMPHTREQDLSSISLDEVKNVARMVFRNADPIAIVASPQS